MYWVFTIYKRSYKSSILQMSDWDRFAAEEYELLVAEEGNADGTMDEL